MSGGASAAEAARYFDGDADAILRLQVTKDNELPLPFGSKREPIPTFSTGKHAVMVSGVTNPGDTFETYKSGNFSKDMIELYCGVLLESQLAHGPLPGNNYPRTFLVGPRAGFGFSSVVTGMFSILGYGGKTYSWAREPKLTSRADEYKPNVFDYDRIISVNHFAEVEGHKTVLILIADLNQRDATDRGQVQGTVHACTFSQGGKTPNLVGSVDSQGVANPSIPLANGANPLSMMRTLLDRMGLTKDKVSLSMGDSADNASLMGPDSDPGNTFLYASWAGLALEKLMRQKFQNAGGTVPVARVITAIQREGPWRRLVEQAARVGYMPPRTIEDNVVNWPSTTSQTAIIELLKRQLGVGIGSSIQMSDADMDLAVSAILGLPVPELPAASYSEFNPPEEDDY